MIATISEFDPSLDDWDYYVDRFQNFATINGIDEGNYVTLLLSIIGRVGHRTITDLVMPSKPNDYTWDQLLPILADHWKPKTLKIVERVKFARIFQAEGENIADFANRLRSAAQRCEFGKFLDEALRDKLVSGLHPTYSPVQDALLTANHSFQEALAIAKCKETALQERIHIRNANPVEHVHQVQESNKFICLRCGSPDHRPSECKHQNTKCSKCQKVGHLARVCLKGRRLENPRRVHRIQATTLDTTEYDRSVIDLPYSRPFFCSVAINGVTIRGEIDSGAAVSILSYKDYSKIGGTLHQTTEELHSYTGNKIRLAGMLFTQVTTGKGPVKLKLFVAQEDLTTIFGRDWLAHLLDEWPPKVASVKTSKENILEEFGTLFDDTLGKINDFQAVLLIEDNSKPIFVRPRPVSFFKKGKIEEELDRLVTQGIIEPITYSEWAAPIVAPLKKNGNIRICADFSVTINPVLKAETYPIPRIEDLFATLSGGKTFTVLDIKDAYLQVEIAEECRNLLTINTHKGLFRYQRLPFGLTSAPAIWQKRMDTLLSGCKMTACYLDDIIVTGHTEEEHTRNLREVLQRLLGAGIRLGREKCNFYQGSVTYCGHTISKDGLKKTKQLVEAVLAAPVPKSPNEVRAFCGLAGYYRDFIPNLSSIQKPLMDLTLKDATWNWSSDQEKAFKAIKDIIVKDVTLVHFDPKQKITLSTDASGCGIGAILSHIMEDGAERPISFASRILKDAERNYSTIEKEALAVRWGVDKFKNYLEGRHFTIYTDHKPLITLLNPLKGIPTKTSPRIQKWTIYLQGFHFDIRYRPGSQNQHADALSRLPLPDTATSEEKNTCSYKGLHINTVRQLDVTSTTVQQATLEDPILQTLITYIIEETPVRLWVPELHAYKGSVGEYSIDQGCIFRGERMVIPSSLRRGILKILHRGHLGIVKTKSIARGVVWWPNIDSDIEKTVSECLHCGQIKPTAPPQRQIPHEPAKTPMERVHIDYAGPFHTRNYLIIVDAYSKWPEIYEVRDTSTLTTIRSLKDMFGRFGIPETIMSDNGPQFTALQFKKFCIEYGIKHKRSAPYHPQSNGLAERFVRTFKNVIGKVPVTDVDARIQEFLLWYRCAEHTTTKKSPSELMLGRIPRNSVTALVNREGKQTTYNHRGKFQKGEVIIFRNYSNPFVPWTRGTIQDALGKNMYRVRTAEGEEHRRHQDQIRRSHLTDDLNSNTNALSAFDDSIPIIQQDHASQEHEGNTRLEAENTSSDNTSDEVAGENPQPETETGAEQTLRRSTRIRRPPEPFWFWRC